MNEFWQSCVSHLEQDFPPQQISAWIRPLVPLAFDETKAQLRVSAPNRFKLDWVKKNFAQQIEAFASKWFDQPVQVLFELPASTADRSKQSMVNGAFARTEDHRTENVKGSSISGTTYTQSGLDHVTANKGIDPQGSINENLIGSNDPVRTPASMTPVDDKSRLNVDLTFDNFVTGKANQLARAAALQVAENPGTSYNPLFLYGGVGLGKTHLIHAIGNAMVAAGHGVRVRYVHADQYVSDVVKAYQRKAFDDFKRYYHSLDLLLIDDIQFFSGKNRTQEEFFYAFEAMVAQRKQIIITSDTYPKELAGIDSRLISRFDSGLTVAIEPPELEMRVAILLRKAEQEGMTMPEEVAFFIAKHLRSNVRELEGALKKVVAYARFHGRDVANVDICKDALKDLLSVSSGQVTVENIQKTVADFYKIKVADMYSKRRPANIAMPRQVAMYLAKELTQKSLPDIGDMFGGRDHTTVLHAVRKIADLRAKQADLNHTLHVLEQTLKG
ncbi:chromosomal replication initiator protein DnaA [Zwartia panacis]|uniref:chromosomal replication initiator protein DnaA n=1 Tax=Zwartia panacis TaxID=2683345 RepID=UPI0025B3DDA4|nr:chromosomal replication initiator protein DnaA [Zwartia panacis]MDN4017042.1 chromosomal replication initiator protein DnaA [Zwartia panacis]